MPTFVLNDEKKVNSYGFMIPNKGINLERFKANPVMLDQHWNSTQAVLGKWTNVRIEGSQLLADTDFDIADEDTNKIAGKVDRGYIKGCSMGVTFNRDYMELLPDGTWILNKCELYEASIVAIPSNANAVRLFAETGELIGEEEVKLTLSALSSATINPEKIQPQKMEKIALTAAALLALGLSIAPDDQASLSLAIEKLGAQLQAEKDAKAKLQGQLDALAEEQASNLIKQAKLEGKITADEEAELLKDAKENYALTAKYIAKLPSKANLSGQVDNKNAGADATDPKTIDEFEKLSVDKQLAFKKEKPAAYAALFA